MTNKATRADSPSLSSFLYDHRCCIPNVVRAGSRSPGCGSVGAFGGNRTRMKPHPTIVSVILLLQLSAFAYGMYSMAAARPVALAFEIDLFRVVTAAEVNTQTLAQAPASLRSLSWTGPVTLASVKPTDPAEQLRTIDLGFAGVPLAALPEHWREYAPLASKAWAVSKPVAELLGNRVVAAADIERMALKAGVAQSDLRGIPLLARRAEGVVLLAAPDARVVGILAPATAN